MVPEEVREVGDEGLEEDNQGDPHVVGVALIAGGEFPLVLVFIAVANSGMSDPHSRPL